MPTHSDLTFITNEKGQTLLERFRVLIKDTELFDVLVGYFYTSGFHALYQSLEKTKKIRILIGISTNKQTLNLMEQARQQNLQFSHPSQPSSSETKGYVSKRIVSEMAEAEDSRQVEEGAAKFLEWLRNGKLEIKAYPTENLHAKLYIMSFADDDRDIGRVITGSSNFTQSGLADNLEFNVELKASADYLFAKEKFEELWGKAVDVKDTYLETITKRTWLNDSITPYQLYLKFLYEYFKDELHQADLVISDYAPPEFKQLDYQKQAVLNAKKILDEYGGVFISDVVGLGKTYMSAMLAGQLDGRTLVLAPPKLLDENNPGSWPRVFSDFRVPCDHKSLGKLDQVISQGTEGYKNVFIDEAHRFRTESTITYEKLTQICRGKRVILVTATPLNNTPNDILSQIKLFQSIKKSTIPNKPDLELFFDQLGKKLNNLDRRKNHDQYMKTVKENSRAIRESVLKYLMVRRTRKEIENYFADDLKRQNLKFPKVKDPEPLFYQLNEQENAVFNKTVKCIAQQLKYARYMPTLPEYYTGKDKPDKLEIQAQKNLGQFMKILLIKRLESSFHAFQQTLARFIKNHELFLNEFNEGNVYVSKKYANKIFELLENDDDVAIQSLLDREQAKKYPANDFTDKLKNDLGNDLKFLKELQALWENITRDPKLLAFKERLADHPILKQNKLIVFSESKETVHYLEKKLEQDFPRQVLAFSGASNKATQKKVMENFDARSRSGKDDYRILITTEVLSEGVNLHRSNVVINYDIPWNPTRLIQRVGRVNRVDTTFDTIYSFNFFPTEQSNDQIRLKEAAEAKIHAFIALLGTDARLLTEGEDIESHELFDRLTSKGTITEEDEGDESELKYLQIIKTIRDEDPDLFNEIKNLPKKARTARECAEKKNRLLTYFRKGKLQKFFLAGKGNSEEIDFMEAAGRFESETETPREKLPADFYDKLAKNKDAFEWATTEEEEEIRTHGGGQDSAARLTKILKVMRKNSQQYTEEQEAYLKQVLNRIENGDLPQQTTKTAVKTLEQELKQGPPNWLKLLALLQKTIPKELLEGHMVDNSAHTTRPREVILSEYLIAD